MKNKIKYLEKGYVSLTKKLKKAKKLLSKIDKNINKLWNPNDVTKQQIRNLLDKKHNLDQIDIADRLNLDLKLVCKLTDELVSEGKIKRVPY